MILSRIWRFGQGRIVLKPGRSRAANASQNTTDFWRCEKVESVGSCILAVLVLVKLAFHFEMISYGSWFVLGRWRRCIFPTADGIFLIRPEDVTSQRKVAF